MPSQPVYAYNPANPILTVPDDDRWTPRPWGSALKRIGYQIPRTQTMNQEQFARRVLGEFAGNESFGGEAGSIFTDLLQTILDALPQILALFQNCPASRLRRNAARGSGLLYRIGRTRLNFALRNQIGRENFRTYGEDLSEAIVCTVCSCSDSEVESLLATAA